MANGFDGLDGNKTHFGDGPHSAGSHSLNKTTKLFHSKKGVDQPTHDCQAEVEFFAALELEVKRGTFLNDKGWGVLLGGSSQSVSS